MKRGALAQFIAQAESHPILHHDFQALGVAICSSHVASRSPDAVFPALIEDCPSGE
jgi:hypothetical protein